MGEEPYFYNSDIYAAEDFMFLLFELDGVSPLELTPFKDGTRTRVNVHIKYNLVDDFLIDWMKQKQALAKGKITEQEYTEWVLTWPKSASRDDEVSPKMDTSQK